MTPPGPSKRARLAHALDALGLLDRLLWLRAKLCRRALAVLTYHRVGLRGGQGELCTDLFDVEPEKLAEHIALIKTHGTVVSIADLRLYQEGRRLPPNPVLITFDDGYADGHDVALPILTRAGVPATFFIPTAYPDAGRLFWWDRVSLLLRRCPEEQIELAYPRRVILSPRRDPGGAVEAVVRSIKTTRCLDMARLFSELERAAGVHIDPAEERALAAKTIMGWSKVRALREAGMDVQSHSDSHRVLHTLTPSAAGEDLSRSARILEEVTGEEAHSVAYPVGYPMQGAHRRAASESGFALGFTNQTGLCDLGRFDALNVPRLSMDPQVVGALYKLLLLLGERRLC